MATTPKPANRNRSFLILGFLLIFVGAFAIYQFLSPQLAKARQDLMVEQTTLKGKEADVQALQAAKQQITTAKDIFSATYGVNFDKISNIYPAIEDMPGLYLQMEALMNQARDRGLDNPLYQLGTPVVEASDNAVRIPVGISVVGDYLTLKNYVYDLEHNLRPITIQTLNLAQGVDKALGVPDGQFTLNVAGYVRAETLSAAYSAAASK